MWKDTQFGNLQEICYKILKGSIYWKSLKQDAENYLVAVLSTTVQNIIPGDAKVLKWVDMVIIGIKLFEFESHTQIRKMKGIIRISISIFIFKTNDYSLVKEISHVFKDSVP